MKILNLFSLNKKQRLQCNLCKFRSNDHLAKARHVLFDHPVTQAEAEAIIQMAKNGDSRHAIAQKTGRHWTTINNIILKNEKKNSILCHFCSFYAGSAGRLSGHVRNLHPITAKEEREIKTLYRQGQNVNQIRQQTNRSADAIRRIVTRKSVAV